MSEDSDRFRMRARKCRELAEEAQDDYSRRTLTQMAIELDEEADQIDWEQSGARTVEDNDQSAQRP